MLMMRNLMLILIRMNVIGLVSKQFQTDQTKETHVVLNLMENLQKKTLEMVIIGLGGQRAWPA